MLCWRDVLNSNSFNMLNKQVSWDDVSVSQFKEIYSLKVEDFKDEAEYNINILSILTDISIDLIEQMKIEDYAALIQYYSFMTKIPNTPYKTKLSTKAGDFYLIDDLNSMSLGELIDLENLFTQGYLQNLSLILSILYRVKEVKDSALYPDTYEPYGNWIHHREHIFDSVSINDVYLILPMYIKWRDDLFKRYEGLFEETGGDDKEEIDAEEVKLRQKEDAANISKKYGWDIVLLRLAGNNASRIEEITKIPLLLALNLLAMSKEMKIELS